MGHLLINNNSIIFDNLMGKLILKCYFSKSMEITVIEMQDS